MISGLTDGQLLPLMSEKYNTLRKRCVTDWNRDGTVRLSSSEWYVLSKISGNRQSISELARVTEMTRQAAHKYVRSLQNKGLLYTMDLLENKREKYIELSEMGKSCIAAYRELQIEIERQIARELGEERFAALRAILEQKWFL